MTGETPQPGENPSNEGNPWSFSDPHSGWWRGETDHPATDPADGADRRRHPRRRAPQHQPQAAQGGTGTLLPPGEARPARTGEAAEGHAAGVRDTTRQLERPPADPPVVERHHDQPDAHRYDPLRPPAGHTARRTAATVAADRPAAEAETAAAQATAETETARAEEERVEEARVEEARVEEARVEEARVEEAQVEEAQVEEERQEAVRAAAPDEVAAWVVETTSEHRTVDRPETPPEPDVMVLPEPTTRNRPTVPIEPTAPADRGPIPIPGLTRQNRRTHPTEPLPRPTGSPQIDARLERLENSPFWRTDPEALPEPLPADKPAHTIARHSARRSTRRAPIAPMASVIALGLLAAFFAWVSAEPFWLAMGHGDRGYATVTACTGSGVTQHCTGRFAAADGGFTISKVTLLGVGPGHRVPGTVSPARMVSPDSPRAYLGDTSPLLQLRWLLGFVLVLFCGYTIAGVTGARRLESGRARRGAVLASLAGPTLLLLGFLIAAY